MCVYISWGLQRRMIWYLPKIFWGENLYWIFKNSRNIIFCSFTRFYSTFQIYLIRSTSRKLKKLNFPSEKQNKTCNKTTSWIIILTSSVQTAGIPTNATTFSDHLWKRWHFYKRFNVFDVFNNPKTLLSPEEE